jgi:hypothetical protein
MEEKLEGLKDGIAVPLTENIEITEIHCHECDGYIRFALDKGKNGEHVVVCPKCGHEHCRVIKDGVVTGDRWSSRNRDNGLPVQLNPSTAPNIVYTPTSAVWYVDVSMDNYSSQGWQTIKATGGSQDTYCQDSWGNTTNATALVINGTGYIQYHYGGT